MLNAKFNNDYESLRGNCTNRESQKAALESEKRCDLKRQQKMEREAAVTCPKLMFLIVGWFIIYKYVFRQIIAISEGDLCTENYLSLIATQCSRIRILRFFQIKKHDFLRFLKWRFKKRKKSQKVSSMLNVYRHFGLKTPGCYGYL